MASNGYHVGIDVGATFCKAVAINDTKVVSKALVPVKGDPEKASKLCLKDLAKALGIKAKKLKKVAAATGQNGDKISIKEKVSEITSIGKGVYALNSDVKYIIDVGSFSIKAIKLDDAGKIKDFLMNNKCAGGSGVLLELVAEGLEMTVEEMPEIAAKSSNPIKISSQCSIFAESEVISYKNEGADIPDLVAGVCNSIAGRTYPMIRKLDKNPDNIAFTGGVAKNHVIVKNLEDRLEKKITELAIDPQYVTAYGAAVIAKEGEGN